MHRLGSVMLALAVMGTTATSASARLPEAVALSVQGPSSAGPNLATPYFGRLTAGAGAGLPLQSIEILVGGVLAAIASTGTDGSYSASVVFGSFGPTTLQAVAYRGTALETRSPELAVSVGNTLTVIRLGSGAGTVTSSPTGIDCGDTCVSYFSPGSVTSLIATPAPLSGFTAWGNACTGSGPCSVAMTGNRTVTATFSDITAPAPPTLTGTTPMSPANENAPTVSGSAEAASTVNLYLTSGCTGAPVAAGSAGSGTFTFTINVADNSSNNIRATATDAAGNVSGCSAPVGYVEDSVSTTPVILFTNPAPPSSNPNPGVTGTAESNANVRIYFTSGCSGTAQHIGTATNGVFNIGITVPANTTTTLSARATDIAGNVSACSNAFAYEHDAIAPVAPSLTSTSPSSPANDNGPRIGGTTEANAPSVRLYTDASCNGSVAGYGSATGSGAFLISVSVGDNTTTAFRGKVTDRAGNVSACSSPISYVEDSTGPATPIISQATPASPANENAPTLRGSAEASSTVRVYTSGACTGTVAGTGAASGTGAFSISVSVADDTSTAFHARATDASGNVSGCSGAFTFVEDSTAPAAPAMTGTTPGSPANDNAPSVLGTAEASSTVRIYTDATCSSAVAATGSATGAGSFSIVVPVSNDTTTTFRARALDQAGNVGPCAATGVTYVEDSSAPAAPSSFALTPASPANNNAPWLSGSAEAASTVRIYTTSGCTGTVAGTVTATGGGTFSVSLAVGNDSSTTFHATATDASGNVSACSAASPAYVEDSTAPLFSGVTAVTTLGDTSLRVSWSAGGDAVTPSSAIVYEVCRSTTAGACGTSFTVSATSSPGSASLDVTGLSTDRRYFFVMRARDEAGNTSSGTVEMSARTLGSRVAIEIAPGQDHACALIVDGTVRCWGRNTFGQLGNGTTTDSATPVTVTGLGGIISLASGYHHTCAVTSNGLGRCWGRNTDGQLGNGTTTQSSSPVPVSGLTGALAISSGTAHTCATLATGGVRCWGLGSSGQLGNGLTASSSVPLSVSTISDAIAIGAGASHSCALRATGAAQCWGLNNEGQLGDGTLTNRYSPVTVGGVAGAVDLTAGSFHACVRTASGGALCWGDNASGQLGDGTTTDRASAVAVGGLSSVTGIDAGYISTCATLAAGTARCWGLNTFGQVGDGTTTVRPTPTAVSGLTDATEIGAGYDHACAVRSDGTARCWGRNAYGNLGSGTTTDSSTPVSVTGLSAITGVTSITPYYVTTCAVASDGTARCWGYNPNGQIGDGTTTGSRLPVTVAGLTGVVAIGPGGFHTCALRSDGTVGCWGYGFDGQLGNGSTANSLTPVTVTGLTDVVAIDSGAAHTCALRADGTVRCWGHNYYGSLGNGSNTKSTSPVTVTGLTDAVAIATGQYHTCAVRETGAAQCWGYNSSGGLGDGTTTDRNVPVTVTGLAGAIGISGASAHSCALIAGGTVKCWGYNGSGQLGNGTTTNSTSPVYVSGLTGAVSISTRGPSCAVLDGGGAKCWGANDSGQLGNGSLTASSVPVSVSGLSGITSLTTGTSYACALIFDRSAWCWGSNGQGHLGDGTTTRRTTPVAVLALP